MHNAPAVFRTRRTHEAPPGGATRRGREAVRRGAVVLSLLPRATYDLFIIHRDQPLTPAAQAFVTTALDVRAHETGPATEATDAEPAVTPGGFGGSGGSGESGGSGGSGAG